MKNDQKTINNLSLCKLALNVLAMLTVGLTLLHADTGSNDVESVKIQSVLTQSPPQIDGVINVGEWPKDRRINFEHGSLSVTHDQQRLYLLINVTDDKVNDTQLNLDSVGLEFDMDGDGQPTPNLDRYYTQEPQTGNLRYKIMTETGEWSHFHPKSRSSQGKGFGAFFADDSLVVNPAGLTITRHDHRVWEFGINLEEIGAKAGSEVGLHVLTNSATPQLNPNASTGFNQTVSLALTGLVPSLQQGGFNLGGNSSLTLGTNPLEVTQAIQTPTNEMPLVADKATVARVYVNPVDGQWTSHTVTVELYGSRNGVDLPGSPLVISDFMPPLISIDRTELNDTANFGLPNTWTQGDVDFQVTVYDNIESDTSAVIPIHFTCKENPIYWIVPLNTGTEQDPILPLDAAILTQKSYLETVYPVSGVDWIEKPWEDIGLVSPTDNTTQVIETLNEYYFAHFWLWFTEIILFGQPLFDLPDQIVGFQRNDGINVITRGRADSFFDGGSGKVVVLSDGTNYDAMAHEINHNIDYNQPGTWGRHVIDFEGCLTDVFGYPDYVGTDPMWPYPDHGIQEVGFDSRISWVEDDFVQTALEGSVPDFMSYCEAEHNPATWISPYRWEALFNVIRNKELCSSFNLSHINHDPQIPGPNTPKQTLYVSGELNSDGTGRLHPIFTQPGMPTNNFNDSAYSIVILDGQGDVLEQAPFQVSFEDAKGNPQKRVVFYNQLPALYNDNVAQIQLRYVQTVLDQIEVSEHKPVIHIEEVKSSGALLDQTTIHWSAEDMDKDALEFFVFYSANDGRSWKPVATRIKGRSLSLNTAVLPGGNHARIRILASDGYHTTQTDSEFTFTVPRKPPQARIMNPKNGLVLDSGRFLRITGKGIDLEDGTLPDNQMIWFADDRPVGMGQRLQVKLADGMHTLSLKVRDSDGLTAETSVQVHVGRKNL